MGFEERAAARKRTKELKGELKELRRQLTAAGYDKAQATGWLKELLYTLELGNALREEYQEARRYMGYSRESIEALLACMGDCPTGEARERLKTLVDLLMRVRHECLIREDDLDFQSTLDGMRQIAQGNAQEFTGMLEIMLRSELENVRSVLADAAAWSAPDFFALAYYSLHEDRAALGEMENEQRNAFLLAYQREHFEKPFMEMCVHAGVERQVRELIAAYTGSGAE